jgi:AraC family transcriptional regulator
MILNEGGSSVHFEMKNLAYLRFSQQSEYADIVSPYSRMYLITEGSGHIVIGNQHIELEAGYLYLIPSFVHCNYLFNKGLSHFYIHFRALMTNGMTIYNFISFRNKIRASELSKLLFNRLLEINPGLELPHHDPHVYQTKPWMDKKPVYHSPGKNWNPKQSSSNFFRVLFQAKPKLISPRV